jgi:hypothetical protein
MHLFDRRFEKSKSWGLTLAVSGRRNEDDSEREHEQRRTAYKSDVRLHGFLLAHATACGRSNDTPGENDATD